MTLRRGTCKLQFTHHRDPDLAVYRKEVWSELQTTARGHDPASWPVSYDLASIGQILPGIQG